MAFEPSFEDLKEQEILRRELVGMWQLEFRYTQKSATL